MRTSALLRFLWLSGVGRTLSFPGIRQQATAVPETLLPPSSHTEDNLILVEKSVLEKSTPVESLHTQAVKVDSEKELLLSQERRKVAFAVSLAALSGALDIICFQRFGCFAHLMTGNTVKCLTAVSELKWKKASFSATMIGFDTAGAAGYRMVDILTKRERENKGKLTTNISTFSRLSTILLPIFAFSDVLGRTWQLPTAAVAFAWAFGSGMVNASTMDAMGTVTNAVTGHWNKFGIAFIDLLILGERKEATKTTYKVLLSTALSICGSSVLVQFFSSRAGLPTVLPPIGGVVGLLYFALFRWYGNAEGRYWCHRVQTG